MTSVPTIDIDLDRPPEQRWLGLARYRDVANELLEQYIADLGGAGDFSELLDTYTKTHLSESIQAELAGLAQTLGRSPREVALANLYYDALKVVFACTAFACDSNPGPTHARNLDWHTENHALAKHSAIFDFYRAGERRFRTIGWPGFIGALSGVAPGRFSVSLNAVSSAAPIQLAEPVTFLIRDVLDTAPNFDDAVRRLSETPVLSDSLLLVVGTNTGEFAVVERSPADFAVRTGDGHVVVTNDYRALGDAAAVGADSVLASTACGRFDRATDLIREGHRGFDVLCDPQVKMTITVQQMTIDPTTGEIELRIP